MNYLSDIGGIYNSIFLCGKFIVPLFIESTLFAYILKNSLYIDTKYGPGKKYKAKISINKFDKSLPTVNT